MTKQEQGLKLTKQLDTDHMHLIGLIEQLHQHIEDAGTNSPLASIRVLLPEDSKPQEIAIQDLNTLVYREIIILVTAANTFAFEENPENRSIELISQSENPTANLEPFKELLAALANS